MFGALSGYSSSSDSMSFSSMVELSVGNGDTILIATKESKFSFGVDRGPRQSNRECLSRETGFLFLDVIDSTRRYLSKENKHAIIYWLNDDVMGKKESPWTLGVEEKIWQQNIQNNLKRKAAIFTMRSEMLSEKKSSSKIRFRGEDFDFDNTFIYPDDTPFWARGALYGLSPHLFSTLFSGNPFHLTTNPLSSSSSPKEAAEEYSKLLNEYSNIIDTEQGLIPRQGETLLGGTLGLFSRFPNWLDGKGQGSINFQSNFKELYSDLYSPRNRNIFSHEPVNNNKIHLVFGYLLSDITTAFSYSIQRSKEDSVIRYGLFTEFPLLLRFEGFFSELLLRPLRELKYPGELKPRFVLLSVSLIRSCLQLAYSTIEGLSQLFIDRIFPRLFAPLLRHLARIKVQAELSIASRNNNKRTQGKGSRNNISKKHFQLIHISNGISQILLYAFSSFIASCYGAEEPISSDILADQNNLLAVHNLIKTLLQEKKISEATIAGLHLFPPLTKYIKDDWLCSFGNLPVNTALEIHFANENIRNYWEKGCSGKAYSKASIAAGKEGEQARKKVFIDCLLGDKSSEISIGDKSSEILSSSSISVESIPGLRNIQLLIRYTGPIDPLSKRDDNEIKAAASLCGWKNEEALTVRKFSLINTLFLLPNPKNTMFQLELYWILEESQYLQPENDKTISKKTTSGLKRCFMWSEEDISSRELLSLRIPLESEQMLIPFKSVDKIKDFEDPRLFAARKHVDYDTILSTKTSMISDIENTPLIPLYYVYFSEPNKIPFFRPFLTSYTQNDLKNDHNALDDFLNNWSGVPRNCNPKSTIPNPKSTQKISDNSRGCRFFFHTDDSFFSGADKGYEQRRSRPHQRAPEISTMAIGLLWFRLELPYEDIITWIGDSDDSTNAADDGSNEKLNNLRAIQLPLWSIGQSYGGTGSTWLTIEGKSVIIDINNNNHYMNKIAGFPIFFEDVGSGPYSAYNFNNLNNQGLLLDSSTDLEYQIGLKTWEKSGLHNNDLLPVGFPRATDPFPGWDGKAAWLPLIRKIDTTDVSQPGQQPKSSTIIQRVALVRLIELSLLFIRSVKRYRLDIIKSPLWEIYPLKYQDILYGTTGFQGKNQESSTDDSISNDGISSLEEATDIIGSKLSRRYCLYSMSDIDTNGEENTAAGWAKHDKITKLIPLKPGGDKFSNANALKTTIDGTSKIRAGNSISEVSSDAQLRVCLLYRLYLEFRERNSAISALTTVKEIVKIGFGTGTSGSTDTSSTSLVLSLTEMELTSWICRLFDSSTGIRTTTEFYDDVDIIRNGGKSETGLLAETSDLYPITDEKKTAVLLYFLSSLPYSQSSTEKLFKNIEENSNLGYSSIDDEIHFEESVADDEKESVADDDTKDIISNIIKKAKKPDDNIPYGSCYNPIKTMISNMVSTGNADNNIEGSSESFSKTLHSLGIASLLPGGISQLMSFLARTNIIKEHWEHGLLIPHALWRWGENAGGRKLYNTNAGAAGSSPGATTTSEGLQILFRDAGITNEKVKNSFIINQWNSDKPFIKGSDGKTPLIAPPEKLFIGDKNTILLKNRAIPSHFIADAIANERIRPPPSWCNDFSTTTTDIDINELKKVSIESLLLLRVTGSTSSSSSQSNNLAVIHSLDNPALLSWEGLLSVAADSSCRRLRQRLLSAGFQDTNIDLGYIRNKILLLAYGKVDEFRKSLEADDLKVAETVFGTGIYATGNLPEVMAFQLLTKSALRPDQVYTIQQLDWPKNLATTTGINPSREPKIAKPLLDYPVTKPETPLDLLNSPFAERARFFQFKMGFGKSAILTPVLLLFLLNRGFLPVLVTPSALYGQAKRNLPSKISPFGIELQELFPTELIVQSIGKEKVRKNMVRGAFISADSGGNGGSSSSSTSSEITADASALRQLPTSFWTSMETRLRLALAAGNVVLLSEAFQIRALGALEEILWTDLSEKFEENKKTAQSSGSSSSVDNNFSPWSLIWSVWQEDITLLYDEDETIDFGGRDIGMSDESKAIFEMKKEEKENERVKEVMKKKKKERKKMFELQEKRKERKETAVKLKAIHNINRMLLEKGHLVLDEMDSLLNPRKSVILPLGRPQSLNV